MASPQHYLQNPTALLRAPSPSLSPSPSSPSSPSCSPPPSPSPSSSAVTGLSKWKASVWPSKNGAHATLIYRLPEPDTDYCMTFVFLRQNKHNAVNNCTACIETARRERKSNSASSGSPAALKVHGMAPSPSDEFSYFASDPMCAAHICSVLSSRQLYGVICERKITSAANLELAEKVAAGHRVMPHKHYSDVMKKVATGAEKRIDEDKPEETAVMYGSGTYNRKRRQISRIRNKYASEGFRAIQDIDDKFRSPHNQSDEQFLWQDEQPNSMAVFASKRVLKLVREIEADVLVADGNFKYRAMEQDGSNPQFYAILATINGYSLPLFIGLLPTKSTRSYIRMFKIVRMLLVDAGFDLYELNIVLDFEDAAINAFKEIVPEVTLRGCHFHFSMAFNKQWKAKSMHKYENDAAIDDWKTRLRALFFLPTSLYAKSGVMKEPVAPDHPAFDLCSSFLDYYKKQWLAYPETLTNKFGQIINRTSNATESFFSGLGRSLNHGRLPHLVDLIEYIHDKELVSYLHLTSARDDPDPFTQWQSKHVREQRASAAETMDRFNDRFRSSTPLLKREILKYLDEMGKRHTTDKSH